MLDFAGPISAESDMVHAEKYRGKNENFREAMNRIAAALQDNHEHYVAYRGGLMEQAFLPPGRVQAGAGSLKMVTLVNCFVMSTIHDSFVDGPTEEELAALAPGQHAPRSIMHTALDAATTMRQGGGVGYDISTLRPMGDTIRGVQSTTDGPLAFAPIWDAVCKATSSAGNRRGAQMLVLRCDHPDIEAFIRAKQVADTRIPYEYRPLRGFNMSVAVTDELVDCVKTGKPFPLRFGGKVYREVDARSLWDMIMRGTYDWAEPGVLFIDRINQMNNLKYCETIAATNPCGEQPLPPYGACILGSFNLVKFLKRGAKGFFEFDYDKLERLIPHVVRATDNVNDRTRFPLEQQRQEAQNKRRIGLGVTGLANTIEAMGHGYGTPEFVHIQDEIMGFIKNNVYMASVSLAQEKGSFPMFDRDEYMKSEFVAGLDESVQEAIYRHGIRNSHLTSIAPTGTISFCADNVSSGIEPVIAYEQSRRVIMPEGPVQVEVDDYGVRHLGVKGRTVVSNEISAGEHLAVLATAQKHVDSACSKTVNVPIDFGWDNFKDLYLDAHALGIKGLTTYRPNGAYDDVIKAKNTEEKLNEAEQADANEDGFCRLDENGQRIGNCAD